jgi:hypothetical protein
MTTAQVAIQMNNNGGGNNSNDSAIDVSSKEVHEIYEDLLNQ